MAMAGEKPHAVCIPYPAQGHITPMLTLAKLLHSRGFHITFVNTDFNHHRLVRSRGPAAVAGLDDFRFESIPDGLPPSDPDATQDIPSICQAITRNFLAPFRALLARLTHPPPTCIVADGIMTFTFAAAAELGIPAVTFWTTSACGFMAYLHYPHLIERGLVPLKDMADVGSGYLDTTVNWVPGMSGMRLRDFPSFIRTTERGDTMLNYLMDESQMNGKAKAVILNTFDELERPVLEALEGVVGTGVFTIGPLSLLSHQIPDGPVKPMSSSLWKEERSCVEWLERREPASVVYVNFGSIAVMGEDDMVELAWGLAGSGYAFLWVTRADLIATGGSAAAALPAGFLEATEGRGLIASWCPQEEVLSRAAVGAFLTHCGWNSMLESVTFGVPMLCWPYFAEQQTNCRYACNEWGNGVEIGGEMRREEVELLVREVMGGEKGVEMRAAAAKWREGAARAVEPGGSSVGNFDKVVKEVMLCPN